MLGFSPLADLPLGSQPLAGAGPTNFSDSAVEVVSSVDAQASGQVLLVTVPESASALDAKDVTAGSSASRTEIASGNTSQGAIFAASATVSGYHNEVPASSAQLSQAPWLATVGGTSATSTDITHPSGSVITKMIASGGSLVYTDLPLVEQAGLYTLSLSVYTVFDAAHISSSGSILGSSMVSGDVYTEGGTYTWSGYGAWSDVTLNMRVTTPSTHLRVGWFGYGPDSYPTAGTIVYVTNVRLELRASSSAVSVFAAQSANTAIATATDAETVLTGMLSATAETSTAANSQDNSYSASAATTEAVSATDTDAASFSALTDSTEALTSASSQAAGLSASVSSSEVATTLNTQATTFAAVSASTEIAVASNSQDRIFATLATNTEAATATDTKLANTTTSSSTTEAVSTVAAQTAGASFVAAGAEPTTGANAQTGNVQSGATTAEPSLTTDTQSAGASFAGVDTEASSATNSATALASFVATTQESITLTSAQGSTGGFVAIITETATGLDGNSASTSSLVASLETATSDSLQTSMMSALGTMLESVAALNTQETLLLMSTQQDEHASMTDGVLASSQLYSELIDLSALYDVASSTLLTGASVDEVSTAADIQGTFLSGLVSLSESVILVAVQNALSELSANTLELLSANDTSESTSSQPPQEALETTYALDDATALMSLGSETVELITTSDIQDSTHELKVGVVESATSFSVEASVGSFELSASEQSFSVESVTAVFSGLLSVYEDSVASDDTLAIRSIIGQVFDDTAAFEMQVFAFAALVASSENAFSETSVDSSLSAIAEAIENTNASDISVDINNISETMSETLTSLDEWSAFKGFVDTVIDIAFMYDGIAVSLKLLSIKSSIPPSIIKRASNQSIIVKPSGIDTIVRAPIAVSIIKKPVCETVIKTQKASVINKA